MGAFDARALEAVDEWGAPTVAVAVVDAGGVVAERGAMATPLPWASVTKLVTACVALTAMDRGLLALDEPAGPPGSTVRHLLAHASGLAVDSAVALSAPERTRIYSNAGFDLLGELVAERAGRPFSDLVSEWVAEPLRLGATELGGRRAATGITGPCRDLAAFGGELLAPRILPAGIVAQASTIAFPALRGVLPGFGLQDPDPWGLGFEVRGTKAPHWTGSRNSPATFGHFGRSGTFLWVDPVAGLALACLTDRPFGSWAVEAWPALSDAVLGAYQPKEPGSPFTGPTMRDVSQPP